MKTTTVYGNRTRDVFINLGIDPTLPGRQTVTLSFGTVSKSCAGIQKLVQRYMITFLTVLGSQRDFPAFGTEFLSKLRSGNRLTPGDVVHLFNFANLATMAIFREYQGANPNTPTDERLNAALLQDCQVSPDRVDCTVKLVSEAGDEFEFVLPAAVT